MPTSVLPSLNIHGWSHIFVNSLVSLGLAVRQIGCFETMALLARLGFSLHGTQKKNAIMKQSCRIGMTFPNVPILYGTSARLLTIVAPSTVQTPTQLLSSRLGFVWKKVFLVSPLFILPTNVVRIILEIFLDLDSQKVYL